MMVLRTIRPTPRSSLRNREEYEVALFEMMSTLLKGRNPLDEIPSTVDQAQLFGERLAVRAELVL